MLIFKQRTYLIILLRKNGGFGLRTPYRPMFGAYGKSLINSSVTFVSQLSMDKNISSKLRLSRALLPVKGTRNLSKKDMIHNDPQR